MLRKLLLILLVFAAAAQPIDAHALRARSASSVPDVTGTIAGAMSEEINRDTAVEQAEALYRRVKEIVLRSMYSSEFGSYISVDYIPDYVDSIEKCSPNPYFNPLTFAEEFFEFKNGRFDEINDRKIMGLTLEMMGQNRWIETFWGVYAGLAKEGKDTWGVRETEKLGERLEQVDFIRGNFQLDLSMIYTNIAEYLFQSETEKSQEEIQDLKEAALIVNEWITRGIDVAQRPQDFMQAVQKLHYIAADGLHKKYGSIKFDEDNKLSLPRISDVTHTERPRYFPHPKNVRPLLMALASRVCSKDFKRRHPVLQAAEIYLRLTDLQVFSDGNRRVAKLLMDYTLMRNHLPPLEINEENKEEFIYVMRFMRTPEELADFIAEQLAVQSGEYVQAETQDLPVLKRQQIESVLVGRRLSAPAAEQQVKQYLSAYLELMGLDQALIPEITFVDTKGFFGFRKPLFSTKLYTDKEGRTHLLVDKSALKRDGTIDNKVVRVYIIHEIVGHRLIRENYPEFERSNEEARKTGHETAQIRRSKAIEEIIARIVTLTSFYKAQKKDPELLSQGVKEYIRESGVDTDRFDVHDYARIVVKRLLDSADPSIYRYKKALSENDAQDLIREAKEKALMLSWVLLDDEAPGLAGLILGQETGKQVEGQLVLAYSPGVCGDENTLKLVSMLAKALDEKKKDAFVVLCYQDQAQRQEIERIVGSIEDKQIRQRVSILTLLEARGFMAAKRDAGYGVRYIRKGNEDPASIEGVEDKLFGVMPMEVLTIEFQERFKQELEQLIKA